MKVKLVISLTLAVLVFIFISQNTETVSVNFLAWSVHMSLVPLVFIILGFGLVIGWLLNSYFRFTRSRKQMKQQENITAQDTALQKGTTVAPHGENETDDRQD